ncbi:hypothetical protein C9374_013358 [Naegleria lovaniensis]|uniref:Uncharacterized protein n=1 Tax=Naegleria lovaniensis TaxID=51637 RepID=A0AA88GZ65_NAELO|nr:uncharacterized protein C9374_013358 [Naegleria lovaniensis]KAG2391873.1 hypothetical protein C9374_013358 [Naegleria lovaniensis]
MNPVAESTTTTPLSNTTPSPTLTSSLKSLSSLSHPTVTRRRSDSKKRSSHNLNCESPSRAATANSTELVFTTITAPSPRPDHVSELVHTKCDDSSRPVLHLPPHSNHQHLSSSKVNSPLSSPKQPAENETFITPTLRHLTPSLIENYVKARVTKRVQKTENEERKRNVSNVEQKRVDRYLHELNRSQSAFELNHEIPSFDEKKKLIRKNQMLFQKTTENVITNHAKDKKISNSVCYSADRPHRSSTPTLSTSSTEFRKSTPLQRSHSQRYSIIEVVQTLNNYFARRNSLGSLEDCKNP